MNFIENETAQKLRGGYYTPLDLATYIAKWALHGQPQTVLEPSCGDGVFAQALVNAGVTDKTALTAFELFDEEAVKAQARCKALAGLNAEVQSRDFLKWAIPQLAGGHELFDAVLGNPPFVRYQYLPESSQQLAASIFKLLRLSFTKHTNAWVPFVLASIAMLKPGGRLGMILPAEIIHVAHAQTLRTYLGETCSRLLIIDPEEIWFEGTLQGAVIFFAEKKEAPDDHSDGLGIAKVSGRKFLQENPEILFDQTLRINGKTVEGKWTRALLTTAERSLLDDLCKHPQVHRFDEVAQVDVGIVTGANKFFLVDDNTVELFGLQAYAHPMFGRSDHCPGVIYDDSQHQQNARIGNPTNFIWLKDLGEKVGRQVLDYIELGEEQKLHTRYKCGARTPWYTVPSVYSTEVGMLKRAHNAPRLIHNRIGAYTTDTAYRIKTNSTNPEKLVYCFLNSLTALSAELEGRHYGGGVLELVPTEIEKLLVPLPSKLRPKLRQLDKLVRESNTDAMLAEQNKGVLGGLGLSSASQLDIESAWTRLKNRRQRVSTESI